MNTLIRFGRRGLLLVALLTATSALSPSFAQSLDAATAQALDAAIAGPQRSERNRARDRYRHPRETLAFFGLRRDLTVVEIWPGGGWWTEILAPVLKGKGKLYVAQYGANATLWTPRDLAVAPPGSADLIVTFRNVHNWVDPNYKQDPSTLFAAFFTALKPGGVLGVEDHRWPDAKTEDPVARNGYVSEDRVKAIARAAGFEFVASSDVNRNPKDTHDHPNGVWMLPPDLSVKSATEREKYLAIGESDRMTLKFRKPVR